MRILVKRARSSVVALIVSKYLLDHTEAYKVILKAKLWLHPKHESETSTTAEDLVDWSRARESKAGRNRTEGKHLCFGVAIELALLFGRLHCHTSILRL